MKNALMKTRTSPQLLCAALLLAGSALAQAQSIKPGLWEVKMQPQLSPERQAAMAQAQQQLAQMPAEQRKMMEEMMAKSGVNAVHIIDGRVPHVLLLEILTDKAYGTMIRSA